MQFLEACSKLREIGWDGTVEHCGRAVGHDIHIETVGLTEGGFNDKRDGCIDHQRETVSQALCARRARQTEQTTAAMEGFRGDSSDTEFICCADGQWTSKEKQKGDPEDNRDICGQGITA